MSRLLFISFTLAMLVSGAGAQVVKPIDWNKMSRYGDKQFQTKGWQGKGYPTREYNKPGEVSGKVYPVREYNQSSKSFETKRAHYSSKAVAAPVVETKAHSDSRKEFSTKSYETKQAKTRELTHQIADKPTTHWQTLTPKSPPKGRPGKHTDIPFSEWKATSETK